jgi:hypothetical protein
MRLAEEALDAAANASTSSKYEGVSETAYLLGKSAASMEYTIIGELSRLKASPCQPPETPPPPPPPHALPLVTAGPPAGGNPPPVLTLDTEKVCAQCQAIADHIAYIQGRIDQLRRSQASLRRYANLKDPNIQRALKEDDDKIAAYEAEIAKLQERLKKCLERCNPKQTGWIGGGNTQFALVISTDIVETSSTTTVTSSTDKRKTKYDPTQVMVSGRAEIGSWFVMSQMTFAGSPHGSFSDVFPATPALNFTATVNSGNVYSFEGDAGYTLFRTSDFSVGVFGGYYTFNEFLYGVFPGFAANFSLLSDQWSAGQGGVVFDKKFALGTMPFDLSITAAALSDHLRATAFGANGAGARASGMLSFPLGPLSANIYAQYTDLNASGSTVGGVPLRYNNQNWAVGGGISYSFGGLSTASTASMVFKAPSK